MSPSAPLLNAKLTRPDAGAALLALTIAVVGIAFFCTEHKPLVTKMEAYGTTADDFEAHAGGKSLIHQFGFVLIGTLGTGCLWLRGGRRFNICDGMAMFLMLFFLWCCASLAWSIDPERTARRLGVMAFCVCGALGVGKQLSPRQLCLFAACITAFYAIIGLGIELALGTFRPWSAEYRFAGTLHPNSQGGNCACLCLATVCLWWTSRRRWLLVLTFLLGAGLLVMTKSRTSCVALGICLAAIWALRAPLRVKVWTAYAAAFSLSLVLLVVLMGGDELADKVTETLLLGRKEHAGTLTGRTELWEELTTYIAKRPILGYGYTGFWTTRHMSDISEELYWGISSAHSIYLELLLGMGIVGALLLISAVLWGLARGAWRYCQSGDAGFAFLVALLLYAGMDGITESSFIGPSFLTFLAGCGLAQLAFFRERNELLPASQPLGRPELGGNSWLASTSG